MRNKKIVVLLLVMILLISGCGANTKDTQKDSQSEVSNTENTVTENSELESSEIEESEIEDSQVVDVVEVETIMYAQTSVNVRKEASTESEKLGSLSTNQEVTALGEPVNGWQKIRYNNGVAYVFAEYLGLEKKKVVTETVMEVDEITADDFIVPSDIDLNGTVIVIDAGHQGKQNSKKEPVGPGSKTMKTKVASGTRGVSTGKPEYVLTLEVSLKLRDELKARGYQVVMIRETHNINISNAERAKVANKLNADAFIRVHADGSDSSSAQGALTICQTPSNPFNAAYYSVSRRLSDCVVNSFCASTGAKNRGVWETDTMTGINWCTVPTTILEMGFMTNPTEDELMASESYQNKMVQGVANGIDAYFGR